MYNFSTTDVTPWHTASALIVIADIFAQYKRSPVWPIDFNSPQNIVLSLHNKHIPIPALTIIDVKPKAIASSTV